jgi:type I restriction enzyme M protein
MQLSFLRRCVKAWDKRNYITDEQIHQITDIYTGFAKGEHCKIFDNEDFDFTKVMVERPEMKKGKIVKDKEVIPSRIIPCVTTKKSRLKRT